VALRRYRMRRAERKIWLVTWGFLCCAMGVAATARKTGVGGTKAFGVWRIIINKAAAISAISNMV